MTDSSPISAEYEKYLRWTTDRFAAEGLTLDRALRWLAAECGEAHEALLLLDKVIPRKRHIERTTRDVADELADVVCLSLIAMLLAGEDPAERLAAGIAKNRDRWAEWDRAATPAQEETGDAARS